jgi:hypothetical protein
MKELRNNAYLMLAVTVILLLTAILCFLTENSMDLILLGIGVFFGGATIRKFRKIKQEKAFLSY